MAYIKQNSELKEILGWSLLVLEILLAIIGIIEFHNSDMFVYDFNVKQQQEYAKKEKTSIYDSQLVMLKAKLKNPNLSETAKINIQAQIDAITILKGGEKK